MKRFLFMKKLACLALFISALACATSRAATFTVINTNLTGAGSLSNAISLANGTAAQDTIEFNIPGAGPHTITLSNALPNITNSLIIDGYTQPGSSPNTLANGENAVLLIEINGNSLAGLSFLASASNSVVRGLVLNRFGSLFTISLASSNNVIEGCFF